MIKQVVYLFMRYLFNQISFRTRIHFKLKIKFSINNASQWRIQSKISKSCPRNTFRLSVLSIDHSVSCYERCFVSKNDVPRLTNLCSTR